MILGADFERIPTKDAEIWEHKTTLPDGGTIRVRLEKKAQWWDGSLDVDEYRDKSMTLELGRAGETCDEALTNVLNRYLWSSV